MIKTEVLEEFLEQHGTTKKTVRTRPIAVLAGAFAAAFVGQWLFRIVLFALHKTYASLGVHPAPTQIFWAWGKSPWLLAFAGISMVIASILILTLKKNHQRWMLILVYCLFWAFFYAIGYWAF